jgi:hypothetical protein
MDFLWVPMHDGACQLQPSSLSTLRIAAGYMVVSGITEIFHKGSRERLPEIRVLRPKTKTRV